MLAQRREGWRSCARGRGRGRKRRHARTQSQHARARACTPRELGVGGGGRLEEVVLLPGEPGADPAEGPEHPRLPGPGRLVLRHRAHVLPQQASPGPPGTEGGGHDEHVELLPAARPRPRRPGIRPVSPAARRARFPGSTAGLAVSWPLQPVGSALVPRAHTHEHGNAARSEHRRRRSPSN